MNTWIEPLQQASHYARFGWPPVSEEAKTSNSQRSAEAEKQVTRTLKLIKGRMTAEQIAKFTGADRSTTFKRLKILLNRELICREKDTAGKVHRMAYVYFRKSLTDANKTCED